VQARKQQPWGGGEWPLRGRGRGRPHVTGKAATKRVRALQVARLQGVAGMADLPR
jgi:hypothetical protein